MVEPETRGPKSETKNRNMAHGIRNRKEDGRKVKTDRGNLGRGARNPDRVRWNTGHSTQNTEHGTRNMKPFSLLACRTEMILPETRNTEYGFRSTEHEI